MSAYFDVRIFMTCCLTFNLLPGETLDHCPSGTEENLLADSSRIPDSAFQSATTTSSLRSRGVWTAPVGGAKPSLTIALGADLLITSIGLNADSSVIIKVYDQYDVILLMT